MEFPTGRRCSYWAHKAHMLLCCLLIVVCLFDVVTVVVVVAVAVEEISARPLHGNRYRDR